MTVQELMDILSKLDPNKEVHVWNSEWDSKDPIDWVEVNQDGEVVIF